MEGSDLKCDKCHRISQLRGQIDSKGVELAGLISSPSIFLENDISLVTSRKVRKTRKFRGRKKRSV